MTEKLAARDMSIRALARAIGYDNSVLAGILRGGSKARRKRPLLPPLEKLNEVAEALELSDYERTTMCNLAYREHAPPELIETMDRTDREQERLREQLREMETLVARLEAGAAVFDQIAGERDELAERVGELEAEIAALKQHRKAR